MTNAEPLRFAREKGGLCVYAGERAAVQLPPDFLAALRTGMAPEQHNGSVLLHRRVRESVPCSPNWTLETAPGGRSAAVHGTLADAVHTPWTLVLEQKGPGTLDFCARLGARAPWSSERQAAAADSAYTELQLSLCALAEEHFYGFGEQFTHFDMRGKAFCLCVSEQGIGRGAQPVSTLVNLASRGSAGDDFTTYAPMPLFVTSENRGALWNENTIYHFDAAKTAPDRISAAAHGLVMSGAFFWADTPLALLECHTARTGRLRALPAFAYGTILGIRGGRDTAERVLAACEARGVQVSALWIEDWQGRRGKNGGPPLWWRWYPDEALYPDFRRWAASLRGRGIALMGYANPFLSADETNPLYCEARANRYLIRNADGSDYISHFFSGREYTFACVDLTNPAAFAWLKEKMRAGMLENGLAGWMADYGEYVPLAGKTAEPDIVKAHCALPVLWAKLNSELIDEAGGRGQLLAFHRSAGMGSNAFAAAYWAGDQNPTFDAHDGLASAVTALITSGISGMSINHTDIGGFTTLMTPVYKLTRKKEVLLRWLEFAAFTPIFRTHDGNYANPRNYQFYYDDEGYAFYAAMAKLHARLGWYLALLQEDAVQRGIPMVRALWLHYPQDAVCRTLQRQFLLGEDVLVSPVCRRGAKTVKAYVPAGTWVLPYTGERFAGGQRHVLPAPLGRPPVLVRAESGHCARLVQAIAAVQQDWPVPPAEAPAAR